MVHRCVELFSQRIVVLLGVALSADSIGDEEVGLEVDKVSATTSYPPQILFDFPSTWRLSYQ